MRIHLTEDAQPFAVTAALSLPFNWRGDIKTQLDELLDLDIIVKVNKSPYRLVSSNCSCAEEVRRSKIMCGPHKT